jgi:cytochrome oxidase Cu insertion factor (SCO1/SenC/PrrC family)/cytochrome c553
LSEAGARGRDISTSNGCAACHGSNGQGGAGPEWIGLADSEVELADGSTVIADDEYLTRAIGDPGAELVAGYSLRMPDNTLSDAEIADVVAYIRDLSPAQSDDAPDDIEPASSSGLSGVVRDPAPIVNTTSLPSLSDPGSEVAFEAAPGALQVVYFGYTNCPDVCPTTMADLTVALRKLDPAEAERIETVMVTIDPGRDLPLLADYVRSFVPDAVAAGTDDEAVLAAAAEPFGVSYDVRTLDDGTIEVDHSPFLYVVDGQGQLLLSWPFGVSSDDIAADLRQLLAESAE